MLEEGGGHPDLAFRAGLRLAHRTEVPLAKPEFISNQLQEGKVSREVESEAKSWEAKESTKAPKQEGLPGNCKASR